MPTPSQAAKTLITNGPDSAQFQHRPWARPGSSLPPGGSFVTNSGGGIDRNMRLAYSEQASLQIDQEIGKGLVVSVGYLFLRAHKQIRPENLNVCPSAGLSQ